MIACYDNIYCTNPKVINFGNVRYSYIRYFNGGHLLIRLSNKPVSTLQEKSKNA